MKTDAITPALLIFCLTIPDAFAQRAADCPGQTLEHAACAHHAFKEADARLNTVWAQINTSFDLNEPSEIKIKQGLLRSQRAWVIFRDADCEGRVGGQMGNGTGRPGGEAICKEQMTIDRIEVLLRDYGSP